MTAKQLVQHSTRPSSELYESAKNAAQLLDKRTNQRETLTTELIRDYVRIYEHDQMIQQWLQESRAIISELQGKIEAIQVILRSTPEASS